MVELVAVGSGPTARDWRPASPRPMTPAEAQASSEAAYAALRPAPVPSLELIDPASARARLRDEHQRLAEAIQAHEKARRPVLAARASIAIAEANLKGLGDVAAMIAAATAQQLKAGAPIETPSGLIARKAQQDAVAGERDRLVAALPQLVAEETAAARVVAQARLRIGEAAEQLVDVELGDTLTALRDTEQRALELRQQLAGQMMAAGEVHGREVRGHAQRRLGDMPINAVEPWHKAPEVIAARDRLQAYRAGLQASAEAVIG